MPPAVAAQQAGRVTGADANHGDVETYSDLGCDYVRERPAAGA
ncbi:MAG: hypothetical protein ACLP0J_08650 [Solirubrobacteraceae bacterium]